MRIVAFYSIFNEAQFLKQSVESIASAVDSFVFLDGRYKGFPAKTKGSNDGTLKIIRELDVNWTYRSLPDLTQMDKRSRMFDLVNEGDWILVIDGDEIADKADTLRDSLAKVPADIDFVRVRITGDNYWVRLIRCKHGARYYPNHYTIDYPKLGLVNLIRAGVVLNETFMINNYDYKRGIDRKEQKRLYYKYKLTEEVNHEVERAIGTTAG